MSPQVQRSRRTKKKQRKKKKLKEQLLCAHLVFLILTDTITKDVLLIG